MDEFGCLRNKKEDYETLALLLERNGTIVCSWSPNNQDAYIFLLSKHFAKIGVMPFGGNPDGSIYVGVYGRGCNFFSPRSTLHPIYVSNNLGLKGEDAVHVTRFLNQLLAEIR